MAVGIKFFKGKRGGWSCQFFINRQRYWKSLKTNERDEANNRAVAFKTKVLRKLRLGGETLSCLIDSYLFANKEKTTHDLDESRLNLLLEEMGDIPLTNLTKADCREFYLNLIREPSKRTRKMLSENSKLSYLTTYKALMNFAISDEKLDFNPFNFFKKGQTPRYQKRERELSKLEISLLTKALRKISLDNKRSLQWRQFYYFFLLLGYSGARPKEISHIKWNDFSVLDKNRIQFIVSVEISKTKRMRKVIVPRWVWDELVRVKKLKGYDSSEFVFDLERRKSDVYGGSKWRQVCKIAGVLNARLYDLRHSYISQRIREGINPVTVAEQVGHASTQMTLNNYSHSSDYDKKSLIENIRKVG
jgi:integrase